MPQDGYSIGRDIALNIIAGGVPLRVRGITSFKSHQDTTKVKVKSINGNVENLRFFEGWSGTFDVERKDAVVDQYFNQLEADYFQGIGEGEATITMTIVESNGTTSRFIYRRCKFSLDDAGEWAGDTAVKMSLSFVCSRRQGT